MADSVSSAAFPIRDAALALLERLIAFDTTSRNSNLDLIEFIRDYLGRFGVECELIHDDSGMKANLLARIGPAVPGGLLWSGHTDVVPVDGQDWATDPFTLTEQNGRLFGRGTADMKSFAACALALVPEILRRGLPKPVLLAFSYDEEVGCLGAPSLAAFIQSNGWKPDLAIIGEPTEMRLVTAHKGIHSFETVVTGHEAHSSAPDNGVNAISVAVKLAAFLQELAQEYRAKALPESRFNPPYTTIHIGVMHGGTARNIIPGQCRMLWEIRPLPNEKVEDIVDRFEGHCGQLQTEMREAFPHTSIRTYPRSSVAGLTAYEGTDGEVLLLHLLESNQTHTASFTTEAGIFQRHGIPAVVCGPGSIAQAHKPNEYIEVGQIDECLSFLQKLLGALEKGEVR